MGCGKFLYEMFVVRALLFFFLHVINSPKGKNECLPSNLAECLYFSFDHNEKRILCNATDFIYTTEYFRASD